MMEIHELAETYELNAADCARWARDARRKRRAAMLADDLDAAIRWEKTARMWSGQARQLRRDADAMRAGSGDKAPVGINGRNRRTAKSAPPRPW